MHQKLVRTHGGQASLKGPVRGSKGPFRGAVERSLNLAVPGAGRHRLKRYVYTRTAALADRDGFPVPVAEASVDLTRGTEAVCPEDAVGVLGTR